MDPSAGRRSIGASSSSTPRPLPAIRECSTQRAHFAGARYRRVCSGAIDVLRSSVLFMTETVRICCKKSVICYKGLHDVHLRSPQPCDEHPVSISKRAEDPGRETGGESPQPKAAGFRSEVLIPCGHEDPAECPRRIPPPVSCGVDPHVP